MMATIVYSLSVLICIACTWLLFRSWRKGGNRLLFWSSICFGFLALNNALATIDVNTATEVMDLSTARLCCGLFSMGSLIFGLTWESV